MSSSPSWIASAALALIRAYKYLISPSLTGGCRFVPTCADYTAEAIARHGFIRGGLLGAWRLCKCQPLGPAGQDPVPQRLESWDSWLGATKRTVSSLKPRASSRADH